MNKNLIAVGGFLLCQTLFASAGDEFSLKTVSSAQRSEVFETWVSPRVPGAVTRIQALVTKERVREAIPIYYDQYKPTHPILDPGYSFGNITPFMAGCLQEIRKRHESKRSAVIKEPSFVTPMKSDLAKGCLTKVLDLGAGHGFFSRNALVAGGHVTLVENHPELVRIEQGKTVCNVPGKTLMGAAPFLEDGLKVVDCSRIRVGDALSVLSETGHTSAFEVCYLGNFLHYLTPRQATTCVERLFHVMKPEAQVYARVHTGFTSEEDFKAYDTNLKLGKKFPGYMVLDQITLLSGGDTSTQSIHPLDELTQELSPVVLSFGHYQKDDKRTLAEKYAQGLQKRGSLPIQCQHRSLMIFDAQMLKGLFERAGFEILSCYFEIKGDLHDIESTQETFVDAASYGAHYLTLVAKRP